MNPSLKTPLRLAATGLVILIGFLILHALGWRSHTSFFSGTVSEQGNVSAFKALAYTALCFLAWFVAPIYFLAAIIHWTIFRHTQTAPHPAPATQSPTPETQS
jgi:hypothetical protein